MIPKTLINGVTDFLSDSLLAKQALAKEKSQLTGIYLGNPNRGTARPTTERMLKAFEHIDLLILPLEMLSEASEISFVTPLSPVQERILNLLGLPTSLYTFLQSDDHGHRLSQGQNNVGRTDNLPDHHCYN